MHDLSCQLALGCVKLEILSLSLSKTEAIYLEGTEVCPWRQSHLIKVTPHWNIHPLIGPLLVRWLKDGQTCHCSTRWGKSNLFHDKSNISPSVFYSGEYPGERQTFSRALQAPKRSQWEDSLNDKSIWSTMPESYPDKWIQGTSTVAGEKCHQFYSS